MTVRWRGKWAVALFICMGILASGCMKDGTGESAVAAPAERLVLGKNVMYPENEPPTIRVLQDGTEMEISGIDAYPSKPVIAPDGRKLAYISPYEFEMAGEVWMFEAAAKQAVKVLERGQFGAEQTPYRLLWLTSEQLLVVSGYQYGTVPSRRTLSLYDMNARSFELIEQLPEHQDIREIQVKDGIIELTVDMYNDEYTNFTTQIVEIGIG